MNPGPPYTGYPPPTGYPPFPQQFPVQPFPQFVSQPPIFQGGPMYGLPMQFGQQPHRGGRGGRGGNRGGFRGQHNGNFHQRGRGYHQQHHGQSQYGGKRERDEGSALFRASFIEDPWAPLRPQQRQLETESQLQQPVIDDPAEIELSNEETQPPAVRRRRRTSESSAGSDNEEIEATPAE